MKDFLIIGNLNAATYKQVFPLIKDGKVRLGVSIHSGDRPFEVPEGHPLKPTDFYAGTDGHRYARVPSVRWFTTLSASDCPPLTLTATYTPEAYPRYDNYDAIEVGRTNDIPRDYDGVMGVPISFLDKWCPEQFEIVKFRHGDDGRDLSVNGKYPFTRILIRRRKSFA